MLPTRASRYFASSLEKRRAKKWPIAPKKPGFLGAAEPAGFSMGGGTGFVWMVPPLAL
ncbi:hypothetical protein ACFQBQ_13495 [Granulicella cerasi]|uniref:Uncharacterized protein n=1 Tax=Granulicella cerasi TaxID=741063 RepID=A0ABW1ZBL7_9BACT